MWLVPSKEILAFFSTRKIKTSCLSIFHVFCDSEVTITESKISILNFARLFSAPSVSSHFTHSSFPGPTPVSHLLKS